MDHAIRIKLLIIYTFTANYSRKLAYSMAESTKKPYHGYFMVGQSFFHPCFEAANDLIHLRPKFLVSLHQLSKIRGRIQLHPARNPLEIDMQTLHEVDRIQKPVSWCIVKV